MRKTVIALATASALAGTALPVLAHDYDDDVYGHPYYRSDYYRWHRWRHHWWWRHHRHYDYDYDRPYYRRFY